MPDPALAQRLSRIPNIIPRSTRFDLNAPLTFKTEEGIEEGHCVNVSASGMLAVFERAIELFTVGEISMQAGEYLINIKGRIARVKDGDHGISFRIEKENDRLTVQVLVNFASAKHQPEAAM